LPFPFAFA